jgi:hypothetical protein
LFDLKECYLELVEEDIKRGTSDGKKSVVGEADAENIAEFSQL